MQPADPSKEKLAIKDKVPYSDQLYLQSGPALVSSGGSVALGESFTLWVSTARRSDFVLYDYGHAILTQRYLAPGWYKIDGFYSNTLGRHSYQFASAGTFSNNLSVVVSPAGYPTAYDLTGRVVDQYGNGIPGAKVAIQSSEGGIFSTNTNAFGYYGMDVATGSYLITAEKPGYGFTQVPANVWIGVISAARTIIGYPASGYTAGAAY